MGDAMIMEDRRLTDVSNPTIGTCKDTIIIKTEPVEYDEQVNVWGETHTRTSNKRELEAVSVKIENENMEDGLEDVSNFMGAEVMNGNIQKDVSDHIKTDDENGFENIWSKPKTQNKAENKQKDNSVVIKTENVEESQYECESDKMQNANVKSLSEIDSPAITVKVEYDLAEQVVVDENAKSKNSSKPRQSASPQICQTCGMTFKWPHQLIDHVNFVHEGKFPHTCKICGKHFEKSRLLKVHKFVHTEERPHSCKLCPKRFKRKADFTRHIRDVHGENDEKFKCNYCSKVFKCKDYLATHVVIHEGKKFACEICDKEFSHKKNLKKHLVTHSEEKNFECTVCGMKIKHKESLKKHMLNHLDVRPYKCDFCDKSFNCKPSLKKHLQLHTGERPHKCQYCDKTFTQLVTLKIHEKRHRGEKDFVCGICGKGFVMRNNLTNHMRVHTEERPYKCELCPYKAKTSSALKDHMRVHTGESPYKCDICPYAAKRQSSLLYHKRIHERKAQKAQKTEMKENGTDFILESVTRDDEAMRENIDKDTDIEVNEMLPWVV